MKRVLRLQKGDRVAFFNDAPEDNGIDIIAEIKSIESSNITLFVKDRVEHLRESTKYLTLYCSLIKKEHFEWMLEKATEIGVHAFVPVVATRSSKKNTPRARAETIIKEAAEQSGRAIIPILHEQLSFEDAMKHAEQSGSKTYVATLSERENIVRGAGNRHINLFIGPEGGWDPKELFVAERTHCELISLGRLTLRAETAAAVGSYMLLWG